MTNKSNKKNAEKTRGTNKIKKSSIVRKEKRGRKRRVLDSLDVANNLLIPDGGREVQKIENNNNIITQIPTELLGIILSTFSSEELATAALVCRSWWERLTTNKTLWRSFTVYHHDIATFVVMKTIGVYVKDFKYIYDSSKLSVDHRFDIKGGDFEKCAKSIIASQGLDNKLIDTSCMQYRYFDGVPIEVMLQMFPNINSISVDGHEPYHYFEGLATTLKHKCIKSIYLYMYYSCGHSHVQRLLRRCPNLQSLRISPGSWEIIKPVQESTQNALKNLIIGDIIPKRFLKSNNKPTTTLTTDATDTTTLTSTLTPTSTSPPNNLETLVLNASTADPLLSRLVFKPYDLTNIICTNSRSLIVLSVTCAIQYQTRLHDILSNNSNWDLIFKASYNNLRRLYCVVPEGIESQFALLLEKYNLLTDLGISCKLEIPVVVLNALVKLDSLRRLELTFHREIDINAIKEVLNINNTTLKHVYFNNCTGITMELIECITSTLLQGVEFREGSSILWGVMKVFLENLESMENIGWVVLHSVYCCNELDDDEWMIGTVQNSLRRFIKKSGLLEVTEENEDDVTTVLLDMKKHGEDLVSITESTLEEEVADMIENCLDM